jgi:hypothetical protein
VANKKEKPATLLKPHPGLQEEILANWEWWGKEKPE